MLRAEMIAEGNTGCAGNKHSNLGRNYFRLNVELYMEKDRLCRPNRTGSAQGTAQGSSAELFRNRLGRLCNH